MEGPFGRTPATWLGAHRSARTLYELQGETDRRSPDYVRWVQQSLNTVNAAGLAVDGQFGPRTRAAVVGFQRGRGLVPDGIVGQRTEAALVAAGATAPPSVRPAPRPGPPASTRVL